MLYRKIKYDYLLISLIYFFINFLYYFTGGKFYFWHIEYFWQFLDVKFLKGDLLKSIFYLHSQPPLFNLFTGLILKLKFINPEFTAEVIFLVLGYLSIIFLYKIFLLFDLNKKLSIFLTIIFMLNPSFLMYVNFYFYTLPIIFLLILSLFCLIKFLKEKKEIFGTLFLLCLLIASLIRSVFHLIFFIPLFFIFKDVDKRFRKKFLRNLLITILILLSFYIKNYILFDTFSLSSWFGMNFAKVSSFYMTKEEKKELLKGRFDDVLYTIPPFSPCILIPEKFLIIPEKYKDIEALTERAKKVKDELIQNYNYFPYVTLSKIYFKKYLEALFINPKPYMRGVLKAFEFYLTPAYFTYLINEKSLFLRKLESFWNFIYGFNISVNKEKITKSDYYEAFIIYPVFLLFILLTFPVFIFNFRVIDEKWERMALFFIFFVIVYIMYIGNFFECGENNRFRFLTHSYYLLVWGIFFRNFNNLKK